MPLPESAEAMRSLVDTGKVRHWGVSNLDVEDMDELVATGGEGCITDQVLYNVGRRGPERNLLPWLGDHGMSAMAYSPAERGRLVEHPELAEIAEQGGCTVPQLALAWALRKPGVIAIPKAGDVAHVRENRGAADVELSSEVIGRLDAAFPAPRGKMPLEML